MIRDMIHIEGRRLSTKSHKRAVVLNLTCSMSKMSFGSLIHKSRYYATFVLQISL
jgi:hypothetical protein